MTAVTQWMSFSADEEDFCWMTLEEGVGVIVPIKGLGWNALRKFTYNGYILDETVTDV